MILSFSEVRALPFFSCPNSLTDIFPDVDGNIQDDRAVDSYFPTTPLDRDCKTHRNFVEINVQADWKAPVRELLDSENTRRIHIKVNNGS